MLLCLSGNGCCRVDRIACAGVENRGKNRKSTKRCGLDRLNLIYAKRAVARPPNGLIRYPRLNDTQIPRETREIPHEIHLYQPEMQNGIPLDKLQCLQLDLNTDLTPCKSSLFICASLYVICFNRAPVTVSYRGEARPRLVGTSLPGQDSCTLSA